MKYLLVVIFLIPIFSSLAATWKKTAGGSAQVCPVNYIFVPRLLPYTTRDFCVMKYEAKDDEYGFLASKPEGIAWKGIPQPFARSACKTLGQGYDLISNDQWQTIAINIAGVAENWSGNPTVGGELNTGNAYGLLSTYGDEASSDDNDPCYGINGLVGVCSASVWHPRRRTHVLSNGSKIWDFSGNTCEWVTDDFFYSGWDEYMSKIIIGDIRQKRFGPLTTANCTDPDSNSYCGMGKGIFENALLGGVYRGGDANDEEKAGIFAVDFTFKESEFGWIGFRCVFTP